MDPKTFSLYIAKHGLRTNISHYKELNKLFKTSKVLPAPKIDVPHTHPISANNRATAEKYFKYLLGQSNLRRYDVSTSNRKASGENGNRYYYAARDLQFDYKDDGLSHGDVVTFVDVYLNDSDIQQYTGYAMLFYYFSPACLSGRCPSGESYYRFVDQHTIEFKATGATNWRHTYMHFDADHLFLEKDGTTFMYKVDTKPVNRKLPHRLMTLLTPVAALPTFVARCINGYRPFQMCSDVYRDENGTLYKRSTNQNTSVMSIKLAKLDKSCELPYDDFISVRMSIDMIEKPRKSDINAAINSEGFKATSYIINYLASALINRPTLPQSFRDTLSYYGPPDDDEKEPAIREVAEPITDKPVFAPMKSKMNEQVTLIDRIENPTNNLDPDPQYHEYRDEFFNLIINSTDIKHLNPIDVSDVFKLQTSSTQRNRQEISLHDTYIVPENVKNRAFQKNEAYTKTSAPRNISTSPQPQLVNLMRFAQPVKENILKKLHFYMPGKSAKQIAKEVCMYVRKNGTVVETDFSRYDGSLSHFLRMLERDIYLYYYRDSNQKDDFIKLLKNDRKVMSTTQHGLTYSSGYGRMSGSAITTEGNTLISAFIDYCALRETGFTIEESFAKIGPKYGDDGLSVATQQFESATMSLGLVCTAELKNKGEPVKFLSRVFPKPLVTFDSFYDPARFAKIHTTTSNYPDDIALKDKCTGLFCTDKETPLIKGFLLRHYDPEHKLSKHNREEKWKIKTGSWPQGNQCYNFALEYISSYFGVDPCEIYDYDHDEETEPIRCASLDEQKQSDDRIYTTLPLCQPRLSQPPPCLNHLIEAKRKRIESNETKISKQPAKTVKINSQSGTLTQSQDVKADKSDTITVHQNTKGVMRRKRKNKRREPTTPTPKPTNQGGQS